jgi:pyruvate, water dikinase
MTMPSLIIPLSDPAAADAGRFGPKAANQAALAQAGLPIAGGFALDAEAYRIQLRSLGLDEAARAAFKADRPDALRLALQVKLGLLDKPIAPDVLEPLLAVWRAQVERTGARTVVRSSALVEDRFGSSFAGQFESYLGLEDEAEFITAVRACWGALWSTRALRYMATHDLDPADTAMAVIVQPLIEARASGGGLSQTAEGNMVINATLGLGSAIAQGEVVPDRIVLSREGVLLEMVAGRKDHSVGCLHGTRPVPRPIQGKLCLTGAQAIELGAMLRKAEDIVGGAAEIEWAQDDTGFKMLQARPLHMEASHVPDEVWAQYPRLRGHPAGVGWGTGRARVVNCECELPGVAPGDILVTKVAGPALSHILPRVGGLVTELGGSTSHLASLARERGIPMVLGVLDATERIPNGAEVAVDGVAGVVRWIQ